MGKQTPPTEAAPLEPPGVLVMLDRLRRLRWTLGGMVAAQAAGFDFFAAEQPELGPGLFLVLLTECLQGDDPSLTLEQVSELVDSSNLVAVKRALDEAMRLVPLEPSPAGPAAA